MNNPGAYPHIFVITGAESTGKSTLAKQLAEHFEAKYFPEFARQYIIQINRDYNFSDIERIAGKQVEQYNEALCTENKIVFLDTWLIITKVWFEVVYKKVPYWLGEVISNSKISGFLLCDTDIPWIPDPVRENGGEKRQILHEKYKKNLELFQMNYYVVSGKGHKRLQKAIKSVENQL